MRLLRGALWVVLSALVSGCITSKTIEASRSPAIKHLHDHVDKVDRALFTESNKLLIFFTGRLTNTAKHAQYTLVVPLSEAQLTPYFKFAISTNRLFTWADLKLTHERIVTGWTLRESAASGDQTVPVGPPIFHGWFTNVLEEASRLKPTAGAQRTLFQVVDVKTNSVGYPDQPRFVYLDTSRPGAFTDVQIEEVVVFEDRKYLRWVVPLAVLGDVATSPFQAFYFLLWLAAGAPT